MKRMRAIAEETSELVRRYKGSYSGEHGDGISRSEYIAPLFGPVLTRAFETVKDAFDPENRLNPGKIVRPLTMDDRSLFRFKPDYAVTQPLKPALDWSDWGGFGAAVEMCNNNGTCRKLAGGAMCPTYRATREEEHLTRGRANSLRLAISGQLGPDAFTSKAMKRTLDLCVSCKACRRECPTGVDMAKMKVEFLHHYHARHGLPLRDRIIGLMPHYAGSPPSSRRSSTCATGTRAGRPVGADGRALGQALAAALAPSVERAGRGGPSRRRDRGFPRRHPVRRHVQPRLRAGEPGSRRAGSSRCCGYLLATGPTRRAGGGRSAAAGPGWPRARPTGPGPRRSDPRHAAALRPGRRPGGRPGAVPAC